MNVLIVMPLGSFGGGAEQMLYSYLASRVKNSYVRIHVLFFGYGDLAKAVQQQGYPVRVIEAGRVREVHRLMRCQREIDSIVQLWNIDVILAWMPKACIYTGPAARKREIPMFVWRHDIPDALSRMDRWTMRYCRPTGVACSSMAAAEAFNRSESLKVKAVTIHPGVRTLDYDPTRVNDIRRQVLGADGARIVGTVVRLQPWKRVDLFLRACALVKLQLPDCRFLVVGGESHGLSAGYSLKLRALGERLLGDAVYFAGERRNVGDWIAALDAFVLPSYREPFGISLVEALSLGKPVVACSGGGPNEVVNDATVGTVLSETPTPEEMADAICDVLSDDVASKASTANPARATRFSSEVMAAKIDGWLTGDGRSKPDTNLVFQSGQ